MAQERIIGGRYRVLEVLGDGGMARVFKAQDERLGRLVAVKTLHANYNGQDEFVARFEQEAQLAASLSHPNIIGVYDIGQDDDGTHFIVMEYVEGENLKSLIYREGPLALPTSTAIIRQLCLALDYAHQHGVIHRDIKPENVFLTPTRQVKVGDFGIARALDSTGMTSTGQVLGSVSYFSPEQAQGLPATAQSDLYALGIVLYEMLTRRVPFTAEAPLAVAMKHITEAPAPPSAYNTRLSPGIDAVVLKAIAKEPARRYRSGAELAGALAREGSSAPAPAMAALPTPAMSPTRPLAPSLAAVAATPPPARAMTTMIPPVGRVGGPGLPAVAGAAVPRRERSAMPVLLSMLLLAALAGGVLVGRSGGLGFLGSGPGPMTPRSSAAGGSTATPLPTLAPPTATATSGMAAGGAASPTSPAAPTPSSTTPPATATARPRPGDVHATLTFSHFSGFTADYKAHDSATSFPAGAATAYVVARWHGAHAGQALSFRWAAPDGSSGQFAFDKLGCNPTGLVCWIQIGPPLSAGTYHVFLDVDHTPVAHRDFTAMARHSAARNGTPAGSAQAPDPQTSQAASATAPPLQEGGATASGAAPATDSSPEAQVRAAVQQADDVYRYTMASLDTSRLPASFGHYLAAVDARQVARYRARRKRLQTTPHTLVVQQVVLLGPNRAIATGYKTESVVLLSSGGDIVRDYGTYTLRFADILRRVNGAWRVINVG